MREALKGDNRPIGIFDSGLGGLTVAGALMKLMPRENIVYFGDTGRVPYGTRSRAVIRRYAREDIDLLLSHGVKMIIAACGTVSSSAADIGEGLDVPFIGVVNPAAAVAVKATKNGRIGVIGTSATVNSNSFVNSIHALAPEMQVFQQNCPLFVNIVEEGFTSADDPVPKLIAERYLSSIKACGVDTLILGCTHFPILAPIIGEVMGGDVTLISTGEATALAAERLLKETGLACLGGETPKYKFMVSDRTDSFSRLAGAFLGREISDDVTLVGMEE